MHVHDHQCCWNQMTAHPKMQHCHPLILRQTDLQTKEYIKSFLGAANVHTIEKKTPYLCLAPEKKFFEQYYCLMVRPTSNLGAKDGHKVIWHSLSGLSSLPHSHKLQHSTVWSALNQRKKEQVSISLPTIPVHLHSYINYHTLICRTVYFIWV